MIPDDDANEAALLGTQLHKEAEEHGKAGTDSSHPYVQAYLDYVRDLGGEVQWELRVFIEATGGYGTIDAVVYTEGCIHVIDFKTGQFIKYADCSQLKLYALGVGGSKFRDVRLHIVQPSANHQHYHDMNTEDLQNFHDEVSDVIASKQTDAAPSDEACRWCNVRNRCAERAKSIVDQEGLFSEASAAELLPICDNLIKWAKSIQDQAYKDAIKGNPPAGYHLKEGRSRRILTDEAADILVHEYDMNPTDVFKTSYQTLTHIEKELGKKKKEAMAKCTEKKLGKPILVPDAEILDYFED
jgi:hypothetical protein